MGGKPSRALAGPGLSGAWECNRLGDREPTGLSRGAEEGDSNSFYHFPILIIPRSIDARGI